jgi:hypothetical protein
LMTEVEQELRGVLQSIQSQDGFGLPAMWQERGCLLDSPDRLLECRAGSRDYDLIKASLEQEMGNSTTVLKVEMNANVDGVAVACNVQQWCGEVHRKKRLRSQQVRARFRVLRTPPAPSLARIPVLRSTASLARARPGTSRSFCRKRRASSCACQKNGAVPTATTRSSSLT